MDKTGHPEKQRSGTEGAFTYPHQCGSHAGTHRPHVLQALLMGHEVTH